MSFWSQPIKRDKEDPNDPRVKLLRRFRGFAIFWIVILVTYFVGLEFFLERAKMTPAAALPVFLLLLGCIFIGSVWHAAAIVAMTVTGTFDKPGSRRPWDGR